MDRIWSHRAFTLLFYFSCCASIARGQSPTQCALVGELVAEPGVMLNGFSQGAVTALGWWDRDEDGPLRKQLVIGGTFSHVGGIPAETLATWDGVQWHNLGLPVRVPRTSYGKVNAIVQLGNSLYVGGQNLLGGVSGSSVILRRYDGTTWTDLLSGPLSSTSVQSAVVHDGALFISGFFTLPGTASTVNIARFDGNVWTVIPNSNGVGSFSKFASHNGSLYATSTNVGVARLAVDNVWVQARTGLVGTVGGLANSSRGLVASGDMQIGNSRSVFVALLTTDGWQPEWPALRSAEPPAGIEWPVDAIGTTIYWSGNSNYEVRRLLNGNPDTLDAVSYGQSPLVLTRSAVLTLLASDGTGVLPEGVIFGGQFASASNIGFRTPSEASQLTDARWLNGLGFWDATENRTRPLDHFHLTPSAVRRVFGSGAIASARVAFFAACGACRTGVWHGRAVSTSCSRQSFSRR